MRLEAAAKEGGYQVWITDDELEELHRATTTHRDDLIIQLGGNVALRAFEILDQTESALLTYILNCFIERAVLS